MIEAQALTRHYPLATGLRSLFSRARDERIRAVDGVSFTIGKGEVLGLVGESGCGKSTTGRLLAGLDRPSAGTISFDGADAWALRQADRKAFYRYVQIIFQDPYGSLNPQHNVGQILSRPLRYQGVRDRALIEQKVRSALEEVGLHPAGEYLGKHPHMLSGGQRQRVCIARAIIMEPRFLIADEPVSMLDVSIKWGIVNLLRRLTAGRRLALLYITHDLATVGAICDRIAIMYLGKLVEYGPVNEVLSDPRHPYTNSLLAAIPSADPDVRREPARIEGDISAFARPAAGCPFQPRCPNAQPRCASDEPSLAPEGGHAFACHYPVPSRHAAPSDSTVLTG